MIRLQKSIFILTAIIIIFLFSCNVPAEDKKDDQANPIIAQHTTAGTYNMFWGYNPTDDKLEWAQSFKISADSSCSAVDLKLGTKSGNPAGNYLIRIEIDNSDKPSGTLVNANAYKSIAASDLTENAWNKWTFNTSFNLAENTAYWIVCRTNETLINGNNTHINIIMQNNGAYSNGFVGLYSNGGPFSPNAIYDMNFKVYR